MNNILKLVKLISINYTSILKIKNKQDVVKRGGN